VKKIQVCSNKGPGPLQRGIITKKLRKGWGHLKILFLIKNYEARKAEFYMKAFQHRTKARWLK
jgi:hypothetical protein